MCFGQAVSRTTYAALFGVIGTTYGAGDGSTTFNVPDMRGFVPAGKDDMGGTSANRLNVAKTGNTTSGSATVSGLTGALTNLAAGMKVYGTGIPAGATISSITNDTTIALSANATANGTGVSLRFGIVDGATLGDTGGNLVHKLTTGQMPSHTHTEYSWNAAGSAAVGGAGGNFGQQQSGSAGNDQPHPNVQPTRIVNFIIKT